MASTSLTLQSFLEQHLDIDGSLEMPSITGQPPYLQSWIVPAMRKIDPHRAVPYLKETISLRK